MCYLSNIRFLISSAVTLLVVVFVDPQTKIWSSCFSKNYPHSSFELRMADLKGLNVLLNAPSKSALEKSINLVFISRSQAPKVGVLILLSTFSNVLFLDMH